MKNQLTILSILFLTLLFSCNSQKKSEEVANYVYEEKVTTLDSELQKKVGDWVEEDLVCYGIVVALNKENIPTRGKPVKSKVIKIEGDNIKMKALENINIAPSAGCAKMGISRGQTWIESEGDIFKTEADAIKYLKELNIFIK